MSIPLQIMLAFGSVGALLGLMACIRALAHKVNLNAEVQRKLMHVGTGLYALVLPWLFPDRWPVYMLIATTLIVMIVLRLPRFAKGLGATLHGVQRSSYGDFLLALAVGLCFLLAGDNTLFYILPIAVLTLADAAAALAGTTYGTKRFVVEDGEKSIEGSVVFFVVTLQVAIISFMFLSDLPPANTLMLCVMVAAFGTLVEAQSWRGFDNLFLPLGLLIFLAIHSQSSLVELVTLAAIFWLVNAGMTRLGPKLGLSTHAGRVYVIAVFLVMAVTALQNAILPILVLLAHVWARTTSPCDSKHPDLDIIASLALVSFGWLAVGNGTGWNAIAFYGLSAMGLAMGLSALALGRNLLGVLAIAAALFAIWTGAVALNPDPSNWADPLTGIAVLTLALTAAVPFFAPQFFATQRVFRLTVLSLFLPLAYYALALAGVTGDAPTVGVTS